MEKSTKDDLCKSLRACGLPQSRAYPLLNKISKWVDSCGIEWTVQRLKEYHTWYITYLAGDPQIPDWCKHHSDGIPKGEFKFIFNLKNHQLALAILSCHTVFRNKEISIQQWDKLREALNTEEVMGKGLSPSDIQVVKNTSKRKVPHLNLTPVPLDSLTALTVTVGRSKVHLDPLNKDSYATAYLRTVQTMPRQTVKLYFTAGVPEYLPGGKDGYLAREMWNPQTPELWQENVCGHISCVQEPSLKARWIANPNRAMQHALRSLQRDWEEAVKRNFPQDCTLNQEKGWKDVQQMLAKGKMLASVDLSTATDLLSRDMSIDLLLINEFGHSFDDPWWREGQGLDLCPKLSSPKEVQDRYLYWRHVDHFKAIAQGDWYAPDKEVYTWKQGQPLGTAPSFALLAYTNNSLAALSARDIGMRKEAFWRVIGDDIVMSAEMFDRYKERVQEFGGRINLQKTIVSCKVAEFGGRVIEPAQSSLKRIKWPVFSDETFIEVCSALGQQSVGALLPRQRRAYHEYKYVPGTVVNGNWSHNSHGEPLVDRYTWYLIDSGLDMPRTEPDEAPKLMGVQLGNYLEHFIKEAEPSAAVGPGNIHGFLPSKVPSDFQSLDAATIVPKSGDPRLPTGITTLKWLERNSKDSLKRHYVDFVRDSLSPDDLVIETGGKLAIFYAVCGDGKLSGPNQLYNCKGKDGQPLQATWSTIVSDQLKPSRVLELKVTLSNETVLKSSIPTPNRSKSRSR